MKINMLPDYSIVVCFTCMIVSCTAVFNCNEEEDCRNRIISGMNETNCAGFLSCHNAIIDTQDSNISCSGSFSCYNISQLSVEITDSVESDTIYVSCDGVGACSNSNITVSSLTENINKNFQLYCHGEIACLNSQIQIISRNDLYSYSLRCSGYRACESTRISHSFIYFNGMYSGASVVIYSTLGTESGENKYYFESPRSGHNATVICQESHTCVIYCFAHACQDNFVAQCGINGDASCIIEYAEYDDIINTTYYPENVNNNINTVYKQFTNSIHRIYNTQMIITANSTSIIESYATSNDTIPIISDFDNSGGLCSINSYDNVNISLYNEYFENCGNNGECWNNNHNNNTMYNSSKIVCCTANDACRERLINIYNDNNFNQNIQQSLQINTYNQSLIRCDGLSSCYSSGNIQIEQGNIYFAGSYAGHGANVKSNGIYNDYRQYSVFATSYRAVEQIDMMTDFKNVYCLAYEACSYSKFENISNVYSSQVSSILSSIKNIDNNVMCYGVSSCQSSEMENIYNNVYGFGKWSLLNCTISNVYGNLYAYGYAAMLQSQITNVSNIHCDGKTSCARSTFENFEHFKVSGDSAIDGSNIFSGNQGNRAKMFINTSNTNSFTFYCQEKDTCIIFCESLNGCTNLTLYCYGTCKISCDDISYECPSQIEYGTFEYHNTSSLVASTMNPTLSPTAYPTVTPEWIEITQQVNDYAVYFVGGLVCVTMVLIVCALAHDKWSNRAFAESNTHPWKVLRFVQALADLWTDVLFVIVLSIDNDNDNKEIINYLFIFGLIFIVFPYVISCFSCVGFVLAWKTSVESGASTRLTPYLNKYEIYIYALTVAGGSFYSVVDLFSCKIFYANIFNLQLKKCEQITLNNWRFFNTVLFENIPQFIIQTWYLTIKNSESESSSDSMNVTIVYMSITFSILSIITASLSQISRICQSIHHRAHKFTQNIEITGVIGIKSPLLRSGHAFFHTKIANCMFDVLNTCQDSKKWKMRGDVEYSIEVYYIESYIKSLRELEAHFLVEILTLRDDKDIDIGAKMKQNIEQMNDRSSVNGRRFLAALKSTSGLRIDALPQKLIIRDINFVTEMSDQTVDLHKMQTDFSTTDMRLVDSPRSSNKSNMSMNRNSNNSNINSFNIGSIVGVASIPTEDFMKAKSYATSYGYNNDNDDEQDAAFRFAKKMSLAESQQSINIQELLGVGSQRSLYSNHHNNNNNNNDASNRNLHMNAVSEEYDENELEDDNIIRELQAFTATPGVGAGAGGVSIGIGGQSVPENLPELPDVDGNNNNNNIAINNIIGRGLPPPPPEMRLQMTPSTYTNEGRDSYVEMQAVYDGHGLNDDHGLGDAQDDVEAHVDAVVDTQSGIGKNSDENGIDHLNVNENELAMYDANNENNDNNDNSIIVDHVHASAIENNDNNGNNENIETKGDIARPLNAGNETLAGPLPTRGYDDNNNDDNDNDDFEIGNLNFGNTPLEMETNIMGKSSDENDNINGENDRQMTEPTFMLQSSAPSMDNQRDSFVSK